MNQRFKRFAETHGYVAKFHGSKGNTKCQFGNCGFPAVTTCYGAIKGDCECLHDCYAFLQEKQYPDKMKADWENLLLYLDDSQKFKEEVIKFIIENSLTDWRWFESGDAPDKKFFFLMKEIRDELFAMGYDVTFYAYTKQYVIWDFIEEIPVWSWDGIKLVLSEWGNFKVSDELRKYYRVFKVVSIFEIDDVEAEGYVACSGNCADCRICADKDKDFNVYSVKHGSAAVFPIPDEYKGKEKIATDTPGFIKFGGYTVGGIRDAYCRKFSISGYENRISALKLVWRMIKRGEIVVGKNGFILQTSSQMAA